MTAAGPHVTPPVTAPRRAAPHRIPRAAERPLAFGATCPACGGALRIDEGDRSVRCGYCGSALFVAAPRGVRSFILEPAITPGKARLAAIRYLADESGGSLGARNTSVIDFKLVHVPFWRMRGRVMGWISGNRSRLAGLEAASDDPRAGEPPGLVHEECSPYSRLVFKRIDWSAPACILPSLGLQGISFRTDFLEWDVLDAKKRRRHTIALPTRSEAAARRDAMGYLRQLITPPGATVRAGRFHLFDSSFSLYYYPVYLLRYRHAGRIYAMTIDGCNGLVVRGETPERRRVDAKRLLLAPAALAALAATWLPLVVAPVLALYAIDSFDSGALLPPHLWIAHRLETLLGGGN